MNIAEILTKTSERLPNKMAFYFDDRGTTYQALQDGSESLALRLNGGYHGGHGQPGLRGSKTGLRRPPSSRPGIENIR